MVEESDVATESDTSCNCTHFTLSDLLQNDHLVVRRTAKRDIPLAGMHTVTDCTVGRKLTQLFELFRYCGFLEGIERAGGGLSTERKESSEPVERSEVQRRQRILEGRVDVVPDKYLLREGHKMHS